MAYPNSAPRADEDLEPLLSGYHCIFPRNFDEMMDHHGRVREHWRPFLSMHAALLDACHKRARPIVMTTVAMIAGMLPVALGLGADASFRQPMATAVIGGLLFATVSTLFFVPVIYAGTHRRLELRRGRRLPAAPPLAEGST